MSWNIFCAKYLRASSPAKKMSLFVIRSYSVIPTYLQVSKTSRTALSDWTARIRENKFSMFSENITCAFKNKGFFIKLEIKFEWLYYLEATKRVEVVVRIKEMPSPFPCIPVICEWL